MGCGSVKGDEYRYEGQEGASGEQAFYAHAFGTCRHLSQVLETASRTTLRTSSDVMYQHHYYGINKIVSNRYYVLDIS